MIELTPVAWLQARITQARTKGITYFLLRRDSFAPPAVEDFAISARATRSISSISRSASASDLDLRSAVRASAPLPERCSQRGDSATMKLPMTNRIPGGSDTQKMLRHAVSLNARSFAGSP